MGPASQKSAWLRHMPSSKNEVRLLYPVLLPVASSTQDFMDEIGPHPLYARACPFRPMMLVLSTLPSWRRGPYLSLMVWPYERPLAAGRAFPSLTGGASSATFSANRQHISPKCSAASLPWRALRVPLSMPASLSQPIQR